MTAEDIATLTAGQEIVWQAPGKPGRGALVRFLRPCTDPDRPGRIWVDHPVDGERTVNIRNCTRPAK